MLDEPWFWIFVGSWVLAIALAIVYDVVMERKFDVGDSED